jgi:uncharacterized membrane protein
MNPVERKMRKIAIASFIVSSSLLSSAHAGEFIRISGVYASNLSADGSVLVGPTAIFDTYRWTRETGVVELGRGTISTLGTGAGTPQVSADGKQVSSTILDDSGQFGTPGRWTLGSGWQQLMPPTLPDGGTLDSYYGSAFAISGDGSTVGGLYWRPGQTGGIAHAYKWSSATGSSSLGSIGGASRVNGLNGDGSVAVGWVENADFGNWQPTIWRNGTTMVLQESDAFAEVISLTPDGSTAVGDYWNATDGINAPAIYRYNGTTYDVEVLPVLDGTINVFGGRAVLIDISDDGSIAVGLNLFERGFMGPVQTGIVWTQATGIIPAADWMALNGFPVPSNIAIQELTSISGDGLTIAGNAIDINTGEFSAFISTSIPEPTALLLPLATLPLLRRNRRA